MQLRIVLLLWLAGLDLYFVFLAAACKGRLVGGDLWVLQLSEDAVTRYLLIYSLWMIGSGTVTD